MQKIGNFRGFANKKVFRYFLHALPMANSVSYLTTYLFAAHTNRVTDYFWHLYYVKKALLGETCCGRGFIFPLLRIITWQHINIAGGR